MCRVGCLVGQGLLSSTRLEPQHACRMLLLQGYQAGATKKVRGTFEPVKGEEGFRGSIVYQKKGQSPPIWLYFVPSDKTNPASKGQWWVQTDADRKKGSGNASPKEPKLMYNEANVDGPVCVCCVCARARACAAAATGG